MRDRNKTGRIAVLLLVLAALLVRLLYLGRASLWCDEILFAGLGNPVFSPAEIYRLMLERFLLVPHLPFPVIIHSAFMRLVVHFSPGSLDSPFWLRVPAVLWGTAAVPAILVLARKRVPREAAWLSAAWMAFGIFPVYYSREAYFYAPLITLSALTTHFWLNCLEALKASRRMRGLDVACFILAATGMVYSHLTGTFYQAGLLAAPLIMLASTGAWRRHRKGLLFLAGISAVPLFLAWPFLSKLITQKVQAAMASGTPFFGILWDVFGKFFLGNFAPLNSLALAVFILGLYRAWREGRGDTPAPRVIAFLCFSFLLLLAFSAHMSSYHIRYMSVISPLLIVLFSCGVLQASDLIQRILPASWSLKRIVFPATAGLIILLNICLQPLFYMQTSKSRDYRAMADWVNRNVPEGGAFLIESGYELRFVSGYFPTPGRLGMCPYIHVGEEGIKVLRERQENLLKRFPEIPLIVSGHGRSPGLPFGDWFWAHDFFRSKDMMENPGLIFQEKFCVSMNYHGMSPISEKYFPVWFNTRDDIRAMDEQSGRSCTLFFPGWSFAVVQTGPGGMWAEYARIHPGATAEVEVVNNAGHDVNIVLVAHAAVVARQRRNLKLEIRRDQEILDSWAVPAKEGEFNVFRSRPIPVPAEGMILTLGAAGVRPQEVNGILIYAAEAENVNP